MNFSRYQNKAKVTAIYPGRGEMLGLIYVTVGLGSEAGEVLGKVKKIIRDDGELLTSERKKELIVELGDVLWYLAMSTEELGTTLDEIAELNLEKLFSRKERDKLHGSGDNR